jgi:DNA-binding LacI/PurR family transcriptional regulator
VLKRRDPAVQQMLQEMQLRIERGDYQPGTWLPTERDLSLEFSLQRAGVRAALVGLAEQGLIVRTPGRRPWVSERRERLRSVEPLPGAQTGVRSLVAILPQHNRHAASLAILGGINREIRTLNGSYRLVVFSNCDNAAEVDIEQERGALITSLEDKVAGVILWSMDVRRTLPEIVGLQEAGIPVVFIDRYAPDLDGDFVGVDNRQSAIDAVNYLLELGHTRIAFVGDDEVDITTTTRDRRTGYIEALERRRLFRPEYVRMMPVGCASESVAAEYLLGLRERPTAVFANNDATAYLLMDELERRGASVPGDMSVVGFDDQDRFSARRARLTTMQQPFELMGRRAVELAVRRAERGCGGFVAYKHVLLQTPLIVRDTCAPWSPTETGLP